MDIEGFGTEGRKYWNGRDNKLRWRREEEWTLKDLGRKGGKIGSEGRKDWSGREERLERKGRNIEVEHREEWGLIDLGGKGRQLEVEKGDEWGLIDLGRKGGKIGAEGTTN
jgi:hypothetical protein